MLTLLRLWEIQRSIDWGNIVFAFCRKLISEIEWRSVLTGEQHVAKATLEVGLLGRTALVLGTVQRFGQDGPWRGKHGAEQADDNKTAS
jgi:hypothetical protein